jgi:hypothetical protein
MWLARECMNFKVDTEERASYQKEFGDDDQAVLASCVHEIC